MKLFSKRLTRSLVALGILTTALIAGLGGGHVKAACSPYDPNSSISTPVFNNFCGVPNGIGDEPDFVRVRQSSNGNVRDNQNNPAYTNSVASACNAGDKFDVWTYVHNNAASGFNASGTAIATNVTLSMTAPLGAPNTTFPFLSAISASNAAGAQDSATLNCGSKTVKLKLVPSSVDIYSQQYNWNDLPDSAVNGVTRLGSPTLGSGEVYGCWEYRIVVVYQVQVEEIPVVQPSIGDCKELQAFSIDEKTRKVSFKIIGSTSNAQVVGYRVDWGDGRGAVASAQDASNTYGKDGTYKIVASVLVRYTDGRPDEWKTLAGCQRDVTFKPTQPQVVVAKTTPTTMPKTGPADMLGVFSATTAGGAMVHRYVLSRRRRW